MKSVLAHPKQALLAVGALTVLATYSRAAGGDETVPFAEFGKAYLESHGEVARPEDLPMEKLRELWCVHLALGAFDIAYPTAFLSEKENAEDLKLLCTKLLETQAHWIEWLAEDPSKVESARADITALQEWIESWKPSLLIRAASAEDKDLFHAMTADEEQTQAAQRLSDLVRKSDVLGIAPRDGMPLRILFSPTRRDFVELLGYAGLLDASQQAELWQPITTEWTSFWIGWDFVVATEYPAWVPDPEFRTGLPMDKFDKTGVEEHAVLQTANALQWWCYGDDGAPYIHRAVAMNLAIAVCGQVNALEGDGWGFGTTGGTTSPYERFVPGGNSSGGTLPPMPAAGLDAVKKGRWREDLGREHFTEPLRKGQKSGQKAIGKDKPEHLDAALLKDENAHFLLVAEDLSAKYVVSAPFLGSGAKMKPYPPTALIVDYREFFRAYQCAFTHWLQTQGVPEDPADSAARFRELLRELAGTSSSSPRSLDDLVQEVYGLPLSATDGETDTLEWRFLDWLSKTR